MTDKTYYYGRLIEGGLPTKYARFTARRTRDHWVLHDKINRYTVPSLDTSQDMMEQLQWANVDGVSLAEMPKVDPEVARYLADIESDEEKIATLEGDIEQSYRELAEVVITIYNKHRPEEDQLGTNDYDGLVIDTGHACVKSPTLQCVYHGDDINQDICIFCGQPNERK